MEAKGLPSSHSPSISPYKHHAYLATTVDTFDNDDTRRRIHSGDLKPRIETLRPPMAHTQKTINA